MQADLIVRAGQVMTLAGYTKHPQTGAAFGDLGMLCPGYVVVKGDKIAAVTGSESEAMAWCGRATVFVDHPGLLTPGLVDAHTHMVFGGWRAHELGMRLEGTQYLDILKSGGGILSTVRATRGASEEELLRRAREVATTMLLHGTTTAEAKTGYGLNTREELKMLRVIDRLGSGFPMRLVPTFLGAHAVPEEFKGNPAGYIDYLISDSLPAFRGKARFCDCFCEEGVFELDDTRRLLTAARRMGFDLKIHADELSAMGGAELAAELGATSADHLLRTDAAGAEALAAAGTVAVLLPQTIFTLRSPYRPPVKDMIAAGVPIAIATDFNPGTSPGETMTMVMALGWQELGLSLGQVWPAVTVNAAHAIGLEGVVGALEAGMAADFVLWNADSPEFVCYRVGANLVNQVYVAGKQVVRDGCPLISEQ